MKCKFWGYSGDASTRLGILAGPTWNMLRAMGKRKPIERFFAFLKAPMASEPVPITWSSTFYRVCEDYGRPLEGKDLFLQQAKQHAPEAKGNLLCHGGNILYSAKLHLLAGDITSTKAYCGQVIENKKHHAHHISQAHGLLQMLDISGRIGAVTLPRAFGAEDDLKMIRQAAEAKGYESAAKLFLGRIEKDRENVIVDPSGNSAWGVSRYYADALIKWPPEALKGFLDALDRLAVRRLRGLLPGDNFARRETSLFYRGAKAEGEAHPGQRGHFCIGQRPVKCTGHRHTSECHQRAEFVVR